MRSFFICAACVLLLSSSCPLFADETKEEQAQNSFDTFINPGLAINRFFFELTRYSATGFSLVPSASSLASISKIPSLISLHTVWIYDKIINNQKPVMVCELFNYDLIGIIQCTYCEDDLYAPREVSVINGTPVATTIDWIDKALLSVSAQTENIPEMEGVDATNLLNELEGKNSKGISESSSDENDEENDAGLPPEEKNYENKDSNLRRFTYGKEQFTLTDRDGIRMLVSTVEKKMIRRTFDERLRLIKTEKWTLGNDSKLTVLDSEKNYKYDGDFPTAQSAEENQPQKKIKILTFYNNQGRAIECDTYHYADTNLQNEVKQKSSEEKKVKEKKNEEAKLIPDLKLSWTYDEKGRVLSEEKNQFKYTTLANGKIKTEEGKRKTIYAYTEKGPLPDSEFYENDMIRIKTVYENQSAYTETMYFDKGVSVETFYEHGIKKTEVFLRKGKELRRREY